VRYCCNTAKFASGLLRGRLLLALAIFAIPGFAQTIGADPQALTASLAGRVTVTTGEGATNNLAGITVKLMGPAPASSSSSAVTDADGRYESLILPPEATRPKRALKALSRGPRQ